MKILFFVIVDQDGDPVCVWATDGKDLDYDYYWKHGERFFSDSERIWPNGLSVICANPISLSVHVIHPASFIG